MLTLAKKGEIRTSPRPNVHLGNELHTQNTRSFLNWWKVWGPWYFKKMNACSWDILGKTSKILWLKMTCDLFGDSITVSHFYPWSYYCGMFTQMVKESLLVQAKCLHFPLYFAEGPGKTPFWSVPSLWAEHGQIVCITKSIK